MEPLSIGTSPRRAKKSLTATWVGILAVAALLVLFLALFGFTTGATSPGSAEGVTLFVVGDWGREGTLNQTNVAELMSKVALGMGKKPDAVISTGDNMYGDLFAPLFPSIQFGVSSALRTIIAATYSVTPCFRYPNGLNATDDPLFDRSFVDVYSGKGLSGVPWYAVLGNHDYGDGFWTLCENDRNTDDCDRGPQHQLGDSLHRRDTRWNLPDRNYVKSFGGGLLDVFFIDTNPWIDEYRNTEWSPWNKNILLAEDWRESLSTLDQRLSESKALVKIVVGHHPTRSNGDHGPNVELVEHLEPVLNEHRVQIYFSGHDHNLEHLKTGDMGFHQVVSGAGSDCTRGFHGTDSSVFQYPWSGFVAATVHGDGTVDVQFFTVEKGSKEFVYTFSI